MSKTKVSKKPQNVLLTPAEKKLRDLKHHWQLYLFLLIPLVLLLIFNYFPMAGNRMAFQDFRVSNRGEQEWIGLENFRRFFTSHHFVKLIVNTLRVTLYSWVTNSSLTIFMALLIHAVPHKGAKRVVQSVTCLPHFISTVVVVGIMYQLFNPAVGLYGALYRTFGGTGYPVDILGKATAFNHLYNWSGVWQALGWGTIIYIAALTAVDPNLHEAAMIDGANRFKRMIKLDMPVAMPLWFINQITAVAGLLSVGFEKILLMQNGGNAIYSNVLASYTYNISLGASQSGGKAEFALATAVGMVTSVVSLILLFSTDAIAKKYGKEAIL